MYITPKTDKIKELGEALGKHNKNYHSEGPHIAHVWIVYDIKPFEGYRCFHINTLLLTYILPASRIRWQFMYLCPGTKLTNRIPCQNPGK